MINKNSISKGKVLKKIIYVVLVFFIFSGCKNPPPKKADVLLNKYSIGEIIISIMYKFNINDSSIQMIDQAEGLYISIPARDFKEIDELDRELRNHAKSTKNIEFRGVVSSSKNSLKTTYWDSATIQYITINITEKPRVNPSPKVPSRTILNPNNPLLCVIVDDFGQFSGTILDAFCALDPAIAFAVIPDLQFSKLVMEKGTKTGHEVILHIPMEPDNPDLKLGKNGIMVNLSEDEIYRRLDVQFKEVNKAQGANNHMGSKVTADRRLMRHIYKYFLDNGLFFVDSKTTSHSVAREVAQEMNIPYASRDLFLDAPENSDAVLYSRLKDLERLVKSQNRVLVITHCFDIGRLKRLEIFIEEAKKMGFVLVPPSQFVSPENMYQTVSLINNIQGENK